VEQGSTRWTTFANIEGNEFNLLDGWAELSPDKAADDVHRDVVTSLEGDIL
jgi:hypothetical protein